MKLLYRSEENKVWAGVLGGLGEYFDIDPVLFRAIYVIFTIFSGFFPGFFAYLILIVIIPKQGDVEIKMDAPEDK